MEKIQNSKNKIGIRPRECHIRIQRGNLCRKIKFSSKTDDFGVVLRNPIGMRPQLARVRLRNRTGIQLASTAWLAFLKDTSYLE